MKAIVHDVSRCYGCRTCEIACSWHRYRVFSPGLSAIQVSRNNRTGVIEWSIDSSSCDPSDAEVEPLCVKYCAYKALTLKEIR